MNCHPHFSLTDQPIDIASLSERLQDPAAGAVVTFDGRVRDHNDGRAVARLEYQAYPALAAGRGGRGARLTRGAFVS